MSKPHRTAEEWAAVAAEAESGDYEVSGSATVFPENKIDNKGTGDRYL